MKNGLNCELDQVDINELHAALITGTRPVYFQEDSSKPIWGAGSLFIATWKERQFAITAKHIFSNLNADPAHTRILFPGYRTALPIQSMHTLTFDGNEELKDLEDIAVFELDRELELEGDQLAWYAWNMDALWQSAERLTPGDQLFAVGFPSTDDRYDWENDRIQESPAISIGRLSDYSMGKGIYTIETAEFEHELNGMSGGPVFAKLKGLFHYVGMIIRGGAAARKIHFVDAAYITFVLENA